MDRKFLESIEKPLFYHNASDLLNDEKIEKFKNSINELKWENLKNNQFLNNEHFVDNYLNEYFETKKVSINKDLFKLESKKNLNKILNNKNFFIDLKNKTLNSNNKLSTNYINSVKPNINIESTKKINSKIELAENKFNKNNNLNKVSEIKIKHNEDVVDLVSKKNKINSFFSNIKTMKNDFLNNLSKLKEKRNQFESYLKSLRVLNNISIAITTAEWALSATYASMAFVTFGATLPLAVTSGFNAGISTYFSVTGKQSESAIESELKKIDDFLNSKEIFDIENTLKEINFDELNKKINENIDKVKITFDVNDILQTFNTASTFSALKMGVSMLLEFLTNKSISWILNKINIKLIEKFQNFTLSLSSGKTIKSAFETIFQTIQNNTLKFIAKKSTIAITSALSPISRILNIVDFLISTATIVNEITFLNILS
ncbi:hypothetical protein [[Mycoplasma] collis]|uniref:hypothetical protein n=1 Tax=[Mycoplasma] collis TaxID=2127 RepID=UPI00051CA5C7|nr:hypothetical protein [[Mycoplasma] collis]